MLVLFLMQYNGGSAVSDKFNWSEYQPSKTTWFWSCVASVALTMVVEQIAAQQAAEVQTVPATPAYVPALAARRKSG